MFVNNKFLVEFEAFSNSWWPYFIAFLISVISAIRFYVGGAQYKNPEKLNGKVVIVTGASSGIGYEVAKNLIFRGAHLILAVRNAENGKKAMAKLKKTAPKNAKITVKLLDVSDMDNIRNFVNDIETECAKVDVLINNAAIIYQQYSQTFDGNERTLTVNYLGPFLLTHLLLPLLNKSPNGRIINISAMAHYNGKLRFLNDLNNIMENEENFNEKDAFSQSKLALTVFSKYLATLLKNTNITCNAVSPGLVRGTNHLKNLPLQQNLWSKISISPWMWLLLKNPQQGAQSVIYLAVEPNLKNISGFYFSECEIKEPADVVKDMQVAEELYEKTCQMVKINGKKLIQDLYSSRTDDGDF